MSIMQIIGIGFITTALAVLLKQHRPELAFALPILCTVLIVIFIAPYLNELLNMLKNISKQTGIESVYIKTIIKIIGAAYVCQFSSELCKDAGEGSVASKIEFAGKIIIITLSTPIIYRLLEIISTIINY